MTALRQAIIDAMGPDPHTGGAPHQDTVDALLEGLLARIAVSNARPAAYAAEPWRGQGMERHALHADAHVTCARHSVDAGAEDWWLSDIGQPEAAHAALRLDFLMWSHKRGVKGGEA